VNLEEGGRVESSRRGCACSKPRFYIACGCTVIFGIYGAVDSNCFGRKTRVECAAAAREHPRSINQGGGRIWDKVKVAATERSSEGRRNDSLDSRKQIESPH